MLPVPWKKNRPSVLQRAAARFKECEDEREEELALERLKPRFISHRCAMTGETYLSEWHKSSPHTRFTFKRTITDLPDEQASASSGLSFMRRLTGKFDLSEFAYTSRPCAICGDDHRQFFCDCGHVVCGARSRFDATGAQTFFACAPYCGFQTSSFARAKKVSGRVGLSLGTRRLAGPKAKALPKPPRLIGKS